MIKSVGKYTFGVERVTFLYDQADFSVGSFTSIGCGVRVYLGGEHNTHWCSVYPFGHIFSDEFPCSGEGHPSTKGSVSIGSDCWIADNCTILSGVTIGDGAVVGNSSVVSRDVGPYLIVGGNPAKTIRPRFDTKTIERLLAVAWWKWDDQKINKYLHLLCSNQIEEFLQVAEKCIK